MQTRKRGRGQNPSANMFDKKLGHMIRQKRDYMQTFTNDTWRQEDVAKLLDVTLQQYQKYERGINKISANNLVKLANILELTQAEKLSIFQITEEELNI